MMRIKFPRGHFCGTLSSSCEVGEFTLTEYLYPPELNISKHFHEQAYFSVVLDGCYTETVEHRTRTCDQMSVTFHPVGEVHADNFHRALSRIFSLELSRSWMKRVGDLYPILNEPAQFHGGKLASLLMDIQREVSWADEISRLAIEGLSLELIAEATRHSANALERKPPRWLKQAREIVHERFYEHLTVSDIARRVGVHPVHLVREFRKFFRETIGEYVRRRRVDFARQQLASSDIPIVDIAAATGFSHQSHFSKTFKRLTGTTPARYRAAFR